MKRFAHGLLALAASGISFSAGAGELSTQALALANGQRIVLPADASPRAWAHEMVDAQDLPAVVKACRTHKGKSERLAEFCSAVEHRNALMAL